MGEQISDIVVGSMMLAFGLLGLILAANAHDLEIYIFGLSLAGFAGLFLFGQVRRHYDTRHAAAPVRVEAGREARHG